MSVHECTSCEKLLQKSATNAIKHVESEKFVSSQSEHSCQQSESAQVCVFTAPLFSAFCALAAYLFVKEIRGQGAGLTAAAFMAMVPSYISRSVAGSFDNEGVAIFALVFVFYLYVKVSL